MDELNFVNRMILSTPEDRAIRATRFLKYGGYITFSHKGPRNLKWHINFLRWRITNAMIPWREGDSVRVYTTKREG